jgi:hypothetical protein
MWILCKTKENTEGAMLWSYAPKVKRLVDRLPILSTYGAMKTKLII